MDSGFWSFIIVFIALVGMLMYLRIKISGSETYEVAKNLVSSANTNMLKTGSMIPSFYDENRNKE